MRDAVPGWQMSSIWHEIGAQKNLGVIRRETRFHDKTSAMVISGPMFYVGNPIYKVSAPGLQIQQGLRCSRFNQPSPDDYLPRTNYAPRST